MHGHVEEIDRPRQDLDKSYAQQVGHLSLQLDEQRMEQDGFQQVLEEKYQHIATLKELLATEA